MRIRIVVLAALLGLGVGCLRATPDPATVREERRLQNERENDAAMTVAPQLAPATTTAPTVQDEVAAAKERIGQMEEQRSAARALADREVEELKSQCDAQKAEWSASHPPAPPPVPVSPQRIAKFCHWGWNATTLDGARAEVRSFGSSTTIEVRPGVEPWVDCKPGTPDDVEAAAIRLVKPTDPSRQARLVETGACLAYSNAKWKRMESDTTPRVFREGH